MNRNGQLQAYILIAGFALATMVIAGIAISQQAQIQGQQAGQQQLYYLLQQDNLRHVLDKSTTRAIATTIQANTSNGCNLNSPTTLQSTFNTKFSTDQQTVSASGSTAAPCTFSNPPTVTISSSTVTVAGSITCQDAAGNKTVQSVTYKKTVAPLSSCNFVITDNQTSLDEIRCTGASCVVCTATPCP